MQRIRSGFRAAHRLPEIVLDVTIWKIPEDWACYFWSRETSALTELAIT